MTRRASLVSLHSCLFLAVAVAGASCRKEASTSGDTTTRQGAINVGSWSPHDGTAAPIPSTTIGTARGQFSTNNMAATLANGQVLVAGGIAAAAASTAVHRLTTSTENSSVQLRSQPERQRAWLRRPHRAQRVGRLRQRRGSAGRRRLAHLSAGRRQLQRLRRRQPMERREHLLDAARRADDDDLPVHAVGDADDGWARADCGWTHRRGHRRPHQHRDRHDGVLQPGDQRLLCDRAAVARRRAPRAHRGALDLPGAGRRLRDQRGQGLVRGRPLRGTASAAAPSPRPRFSIRPTRRLRDRTGPAGCRPDVRGCRPASRRQDPVLRWLQQPRLRRRLARDLRAVRPGERHAQLSIRAREHEHRRRRVLDDHPARPGGSSRSAATTAPAGRRWRGRSCTIRSPAPGRTPPDR